MRETAIVFVFIKINLGVKENNDSTSILAIMMPRGLPESIKIIYGIFKN